MVTAERKKGDQRKLLTSTIDSKEKEEKHKTHYMYIRATCATQKVISIVEDLITWQARGLHLAGSQASND